VDTKQAVLDQRSEVSAYVHLNGWVYYIECSPTADVVTRWPESSCPDHNSRYQEFILEEKESE
jgi:hypothetical protein